MAESAAQLAVESAPAVSVESAHAPIVLMRERGAKPWTPFKDGSKKGFSKSQEALINKTLAGLIGPKAQSFMASPRIYRSLDRDAILTDNQIRLFTVPYEVFYQRLGATINEHNRAHTKDQVAFPANWRLCFYSALVRVNGADEPIKAIFSVTSQDLSENVATRIDTFCRKDAKVELKACARVILRRLAAGDASPGSADEPSLEEATAELAEGLFGPRKKRKIPGNKGGNRTPEAVLEARKMRAHVESVAYKMQAEELMKRAGDEEAKGGDKEKALSLYRMALERLMDASAVAQRRVGNRPINRVLRMPHGDEVRRLEEFDSMMSRYLRAGNRVEMIEAAREIEDRFSMSYDHESGLVSGGIIQDVLRQSEVAGKETNVIRVGRNSKSDKRMTLNLVPNEMGVKYFWENVIIEPSLARDGLLRLRVYQVERFTPQPLFDSYIDPLANENVKVRDEFKEYTLAPGKSGRGIPDVFYPVKIEYGNGRACVFSITVKSGKKGKYLDRDISIGSMFEFYDGELDEYGGAWLRISDSGKAEVNYLIYFDPHGPPVGMVSWDIKKQRFGDVAGALKVAGKTVYEEVYDWTLTPPAPNERKLYFERVPGKGSRTLVYDKMFLYTGMRNKGIPRFYLVTSPEEKAASGIPRIDYFADESYDRSSYVGSSFYRPRPGKEKSYFSAMLEMCYRIENWDPKKDEHPPEGVVIQVSDLKNCRVSLMNEKAQEVFHAHEYLNMGKGFDSGIPKRALSKVGSVPVFVQFFVKDVNGRPCKAMRLIRLGDRVNPDIFVREGHFDPADKKNGPFILGPYENRPLTRGERESVVEEMRRLGYFNKGRENTSLLTFENLEIKIEQLGGALGKRGPSEPPKGASDAADGEKPLDPRKLREALKKESKADLMAAKQDNLNAALTYTEAADSLQPYYATDPAAREAIARMRTAAKIQDTLHRYGEKASAAHRLMVEGDALSKAKRPEEAIRAYKTALAKLPLDGNFDALRQEITAKKEKLEAAAAYKSGLARAEEAEKAGDEASKAGNHSEAIRFYTRALTALPFDDAQGRRNKASRKREELQVKLAEAEVQNGHAAPDIPDTFFQTEIGRSVQKLRQSAGRVVKEEDLLALKRTAEDLWYIKIGRRASNPEYQERLRFWVRYLLKGIYDVDTGRVLVTLGPPAQAAPKPPARALQGAI
ncbi:MAG: tetratricopeptide repeat protein [Candidatus Omnitrophota bacterium]